MAKRDVFPDHPGIILKEEFLDQLNIKPGTLAAAIGVSRDRISEIVKGKREITPDTALRLAAFFDMSPDFWMNLQNHYDLVMAERKFSVKVVRAIKLRSRSIIRPQVEQRA